MPKRLSEVDLPIRTISAHASHEKSTLAQMEWQSVVKIKHYTIRAKAIREASNGQL